MAIKYFKDQYSFLSNFYDSQISYKGLVYDTVEHAYQASKSWSIKVKQEIKNCSTPMLCKKMGRSASVTKTMHKNWDQIKYSVMTELVTLKFQNPTLRTKLLSTGGERIVEGNHWHDNYWGKCFCDKCKDIKGENKLGIILMKLRGEINNTQVKDNQQLGLRLNDEDQETELLELIVPSSKDKKEQKNNNIPNSLPKDQLENIVIPTIVYSTDILHSETSTGNIKYWQGHVVYDGTFWYTQTSYWQINKKNIQSKIQFSELTKIEGKNIGKANATTDEEQAFSAIKSEFNEKHDRKGYLLDGESISDKNIFPMLALKYKDAKHRLGNNLCVQPKLDGFRCLYDGTKMWTRSSLEIIPVIYKHLHFDTKGYIIDGETMLSKPYTFEQTRSASTKYNIILTPKLTYFVFDIVDTKLPFSERYKILKDIVDNCENKNIVLVPCYDVNSEEEIMEYQNKFVNDGHEGTMVRDKDSVYKCGHRSPSLLKYKDFTDDEFQVIDITHGKGKYEKIAMFVCLHPNGETFTADLNASLKTRKDIFENKDKYIGKMLTVKYQESTSVNGVPRFGRALRFRDFDLEGGAEKDEDD